MFCSDDKHPDELLDGLQQHLRVRGLVDDGQLRFFKLALVFVEMLLELLPGDPLGLLVGWGNVGNRPFFRAGV